VLKPSCQAFVDINDIANSDSFSVENGWNNYGPFPHWSKQGETSDWSFYGAHVEQGLLFYYYSCLKKDAELLPPRAWDEYFVHLLGSHKPWNYGPNGPAQAQINHLAKRFRAGTPLWFEAYYKMIEYLKQVLPSIAHRAELSSIDRLPKPKSQLSSIERTFIEDAYSGGGGVDISQACSTSDFQCLISAGYTYTIIRGWQSFGSGDPNCATSISNAWAANMSSVDVYLFPCAGQDGPSQVTGLISFLQGSKYGSIWLDIETNPSSGCGWSSDLSSNCNYIQGMIQQGKTSGKKIGVYASEYMWTSIAGSSCTVGSTAGAPLWYADYDNEPNFDDFKPFGGWTTPTMKQYQTGTTCGIGVDYNWMP
jgi:hypothetical protein